MRGGKKARKGSKELADLQDKRGALQYQIHSWHQAQLVYTPHVATMVAESATLDESGMPRVEMAENTPLFLPSSMPAHYCSLSEMSRVCDMEKQLRVAQADDALAEIRKQRRIVQGLWQFKKINISGTGNRPNTRMLTVYNRIKHKIDCAAQHYRTAQLALASLDPGGTWKDRLLELKREDIRGPGRDLGDTKTSNGRFEPSWIWLVHRDETSTPQTEDDFDESMQVECAKARARAMRWQEEFEIVQEEMRRVLVWFKWKASWWESQANRRSAVDTDILDGVLAYAFKQADILRRMATRCAASWLLELDKRGIKPSWEDKYKHTRQLKKAQKPSEDDHGEDAIDDDDEVDIVEGHSDAENDESDSEDSESEWFDFDDDY